MKRVCYACGCEHAPKRTWTVKGIDYTYEGWEKNLPTNLVLCRPCNDKIIRKEYHREKMRLLRSTIPNYYEVYEREKRSQRYRDPKFNPRIKIVRALGSKCICPGINCWHKGNCLVDDERVICLDHIFSNGYTHRQQFKQVNNMYVYYANHLDEAKKIFQPLCENCNRIKGRKVADYSLSTTNVLGAIKMLRA